MKKVLIWHTYNLKPTGGPSGYLYNIKQYIRHNKIENIFFLSDIIDINNLKETTKKDYIFLKKIFNRFLKLFKNNNTLNINHFIKTILYNEINYNSININFNEFDFIHFHTTYELTKYSSLLEEKKFNGKIILTTHTPKPTYMEIIEDWNNLEIDKIPVKILDQLKGIDLFAFNKADILLFPDKSALEPYKKWDCFRDIEAKSNFKFIPTGINPISIREEKDSILKKYNIPNESFIISYVGRHNKTKGFDLLKVFGKMILEKYPNIYFLIAGKENPIKGISHKRWIEVGWTNDPFSIINACDVFVLPNRETYFDLILLEVMYLDKPVLLSDTGGNKFFKNKDLDLYFFEASDLESMINVFENKIYNKNFYNKKNKNYIVNNLLISNYVDKYFDLLKND